MTRCEKDGADGRAGVVAWKSVKRRAFAKTGSAREAVVDSSLREGGEDFAPAQGQPRPLPVD